MKPKQRIRVRVEVVNHRGDIAANAQTWNAQVTEVDSGRSLRHVIAADWGMTGTRTYAEKEAEEARRKLPKLGYEVVG